jgi:hypothetical protein
MYTFTFAYNTARVTMPQIKPILGSLVYYVLSYMIAMVILAFVVTTINECANFALNLWRFGAANVSLRSHCCASVMLLCARVLLLGVCYLGIKFMWRIFTWGQRENVVAGV